MAEAVLFFGRNLGEGSAELRQEEQRIVAEAALPPWLVEDLTVNSAAKQFFTTSRYDKREDADVTGLSLLGRKTREPLQQKLIVGQIELETAEIEALGEPFGVDAGRAVQRCDADPGVVGEDRSARPRSEVPSFG